MVGCKTAFDGSSPQQGDVHALIGLAIAAQRPGDARRQMIGIPRLQPGEITLLHVSDDPVGSARVDIRAGCALVHNVPSH